MRADIINAAVTAACDVLAQELGGPVAAGRPRVQGGAYRTEDAGVTAVIGLTGAVEGTLFLAVTHAVAVRYAARVAGAPVAGIDELTQSGIGELASVIAGRMTAQVAAQLGWQMAISLPLVVVGPNVVLSALAIPRLVIPLQSPLGALSLQLALAERT